LENRIHPDGGQIFGKMRDAFAKVHEEQPDAIQRRGVRFAGRNATLRVAGRECSEKITPPFRHLLTGEVGSPRSDLVIDVWDERETGLADPGPRVASDLTASEFGWIIGSADDRFVGCHRPYLSTWMDRSSQHIVACTSDSRRLALYERAKPLLFPLLLWHCDRGTEVIHGALVEKEGGGVLFAGREETGKSTSALACMAAGFNYLGDDYIALEDLGHGAFVGHSLYNSAWLDREHVSRFPELMRHVMPGTSRKGPIVLSEVMPDRLARSAAIRFVVLPHVAADGQCRVRPASRKEALLALAPTSVVKRPCSAQSGLDKIAGLVESVPAFSVEIGNDLTRLAMQIEQLLVSGSTS